jgi:hypothetical protein
MTPTYSGAPSGIDEDEASSGAGTEPGGFRRNC